MILFLTQYFERYVRAKSGAIYVCKTTSKAFDIERWNWKKTFRVFSQITIQKKHLQIFFDGLYNPVSVARSDLPRSIAQWKNQVKNNGNLNPRQKLKLFENPGEI